MTSTSTLIPTPSADLATADPAPRPRRVRRAICALLAVLALAGAGVVATTTQAEANGTTTGVRFCTSGTAATNLPAYLYRFNFTTGSWEYTGRNGTSGTGCATFGRVPTGHYYAVVVQRLSGTGSSCLTNPYGYYALVGATGYDYAESGRVAFTGTASIGLRYLCPGM
jgi:hypothetical protein